ncbi:MAG TPA: hypothetical protein VFS31_02405 [Chitinophagaceae bacterium]|nr:hypothetical protein [Chitinophagaceae bacterium]
MEKEQDHRRDLVEIRSMMERSSKFVWLSSWAGIMAGIYALAGAYIAWKVLNFNPDKILYTEGEMPNLAPIVLLALGVLVIAAISAIYFSYTRARQRGEKAWNATVRRLLVNITVPLIAGGLLILIMIAQGFIGFIAPFSLLFYGLALYNASKFTYQEVRVLGVAQILLGLTGSYFVAYGLLLWAIGFGIVHIIYGIYIHYKYER